MPFDATLKEVFAQQPADLREAFHLPAIEPAQNLEQGVKIMHESVAWDEIEEEGFVKGEIAVLLKLARKRFGEPEAKTLSALNAILDRARVERMLDRMTEVKVSVKSWKALLAIE